VSALAEEREILERTNICKLCVRRSCTREMFAVSCWRFEAPQCERCKLEHPERACNPPSCLGEEVRHDH
jgi:predicted amidophosphoribosyltransferase